jgi:hypothetical protein
MKNERKHLGSAVAGRLTNEDRPLRGRVHEPNHVFFENDKSTPMADTDRSKEVDNDRPDDKGR